MLILAALAASAASGCVRNGNQMQLDICAQQDFVRADAALNGQWKLTQSVYAEAGKVERLRAAQCAWLGYRDAECLAEAAPAEGGSIYGMALTACRTKLTQARTHELADLASGR